MMNKAFDIGWLQFCQVLPACSGEVLQEMKQVGLVAAASQRGQAAFDLKIVQ